MSNLITKIKEFHVGEHWLLDFYARDANNAIMVLDGVGLNVEFVMKDLNAVTVVLKTLGDGIVIVDAAGGHARVTITPEDQAAFSAKPRIAYSWQCRVTKDGIKMTQARGEFEALLNLFAS